MRGRGVWSFLLSGWSEFGSDLYIASVEVQNRLLNNSTVL